MKKTVLKVLVGISLLSLIMSGCGAKKEGVDSSKNTQMSSQAEETSTDSIILNLYLDGDCKKDITSFQCRLYADEELIIEKNFDLNDIRENRCYVEIDKEILQGANGIDAKYTIDGKYNFESGYCIDNELNVMITYFLEEDSYSSVLCG